MHIQQKNHNLFTIYFPSPSDISSMHPEDQQTDTLSKFIQKCSYFDFSLTHVVSNAFNNLANNNQLIQKFKKQIIAFSIQYGTRSKKTTSIFLKFLEATRDIGVQELKKKEYYTACYYFAMSLGFVDPEDEGYLEKCIMTKIDIVNKIMFSIFQLAKERKQNKYYDWGLNYLQHFLQKIKQFTFYPNLLKSGVMMIELNYFYLGRAYKKRKNIPKAIDAFVKAHEMTVDKLRNGLYEQNEGLHNFADNLEIKILYKLSKCYREDDETKENEYEEMALNKASKLNIPLHYYISRKIRMYKSGKQFKQLLNKLQNKKKIEEMVLKQIEESTQKQIPSLYDVYLDRPGIHYTEWLIPKQK